MSVAALPMTTPTAAAPHVIHLPGLRPLVRHALSTIVTVSLAPMAVFYLVMHAYGVRPAVLVTVVWYYAGLVAKVMRGQRVLAAAMIGAGLLTLRTVVMFLTGSTVLYFLQPVAGTVLIATVFAASALAGRPVLDRLAHEFCPVPDDLSARLRDARFFSHVSVVWTAIYLINAGGTVWLLTTASLGEFVLLKSLLSPVLTVLAVAASYVLLRVTLRRENVVLRLP